MKWFYSNPKSEQMNLVDISVEYINMVDKQKKVKYRHGKLKARRKVDSTTDDFNLLQLLDFKKGQPCDKVS